MKRNSDISGILLVDKPSGPTSRDVVDRISRVLGTKKVGHTGTLDPLASGMLVIVVGRCTKLVDYLTCKDKEYIATFALGYETDTLDITGATVLKSDKKTTRENILECLESFEGKYLQEVPAYSSVKIDGKKLYEYARANIQVELPKREVEIKKIEVLSIEESIVKIKVSVSKGTYIRSLIRDIGRKLNTYAVMTDLRRTRQGRYKIEDALRLEDIERGSFELMSTEEALKDMPSITLDSVAAKKVSNGVKLHLDIDTEYVSLVYDDKIIAIYRKCEDVYRMYIKF